MIDHPIQDQITLYAADQLDAAEADLVRTHLMQCCPVCSGRLAEAQAMLALLVSSVTPITPPRETFSKINASARSRSVQPREGVRRLLIGMSSGLVAAAVTLAVMWTANAPTRQILTSKDLRLVALDGSGPQTQAKGRVLWDQEHHHWQVRVFDLTPPPPGKTYELWFITTDQRKLRAAIFNPDSSGTADVSVNVPSDIGSLAMTAITDEPAGGSAQPTGSIVLVGKIPS